MKCIKCYREAEYLYMGTSYCEEHLKEHKQTVDWIAESLSHWAGTKPVKVSKTE